MSARAYLDWNATAPLCAEARAAMLAAMDLVGNPSSVHGEGRAARRLIEEARAEVAALVGAERGSVIFTSGGTEANALALTPGLHDGNRDGTGGTAPPARLLVSAVEHPSVLAGGRFRPEAIAAIPVDTTGIVDLSALKAKLGEASAQGLPCLVSIMHANNETGAIEPIPEAAAIVHAAGGLLHVDAVQSAGKIPCDFNALGADMMSVSAHKLGGPKGAGALVLRENLHISEPLVRGGGQERGARGGTENVIGIAGFGAAANAARTRQNRAFVAKVRDDLERTLRRLRTDTVVFGPVEPNRRLPNTILFAVPGARAETALIALDLDGVALSAGSACSSGKVAASHVLVAMGVAPGLAAGALRVSIGPATTPEEVDQFVKAWTKHLATLSSSKEKRGIAA